MTYIKQLKQNLLAIDQVQERIDALGLKGKGLNLQGSKEVAVYDGKDNERLTTITSNVLTEKNEEGVSFEDASKEQAEKIKECTKNIDANQDVCAEFMNKDKKKADVIVAEAELRSLDRAVVAGIGDQSQAFTVGGGCDDVDVALQYQHRCFEVHALDGDGICAWGLDG